MTTNRQLFTSLTHEVQTRLTEALLSTWSPQSTGLREFLQAHLAGGFGADGSLVAQPVFEAIFPWTEATPTMAELASNLLHPRLIEAMDAAEEERFPADRHPYTHQLAAWQALKKEPAQSVVVSCGTGSGKTEAFMVPVLDDLVREAERTGRLRGVHALFLYPLNALIANQRERLGQWLKPLDGDVRFCLYNGNTPPEVDALTAQASRFEVVDRKGLRRDPPPILVTNPTMLEYMLVRNEDQPILRASQGKLRWIILDEAHTYIGSQAAELSLLLRRVMHAFGTKSEQVRFVATSATLGGGKQEAHEKLRQFLADLAGVAPSQIQVVEGSRRIPKLPDSPAALRSELPDLEHFKTLNEHQRFDALVATRPFLKLRQALSEHVMRLDSAADLLHVSPHDALQWLDLARSARPAPETLATSGADADALLPLRAHYFLRTPAGVWACVNAECPGQIQALRHHANWEFGSLFFSRRDQCPHCDSKVFELVLCARCGEHYLSAKEALVSYRLGHNYIEARAPQTARAPSMFGPLEDAEFEDEDGLSDAPGAARTAPAATSAPRDHPCLLGFGGDEQSELIPLDLKTGAIDEESAHKVPIQRARARDGGLVCASCASSDKQYPRLFQSLSAGSPSVLSVAIPTLLEHTPGINDEQGGGESGLPFQGRQLITFTDNRKSTAAFSLRVQHESERTFFRGWLYTHLWRNALSGGGVSAEERELWRKQLARFEAAGADDPADLLHSHYLDVQQKLAAACQPSVGQHTWNEVSKSLQAAPEMRWIKAQWASGFHTATATEIAQLLMMREFMRRPMRVGSLETMGLAQLQYPRISPRSPALKEPGAWTRAGLDAQAWRDFLTICMDFVVRNLLAVEIHPDLLGWMGAIYQPKALIPPDDPAPTDKAARRLVRWPKATRNDRSHIVHMLALILQVDSADPRAAEQLDDILYQAWTQLIEVGLLSASAHQGYQLKFDGEHASAGPNVILQTVRDAWVCPVSRRLLTTTIGGITPYANTLKERSAAQCTRVSMPAPPPEIINEPNAQRRGHLARQWLAESEEVAELRSLGLWTERADRTLDSGGYFRIAEHSAQQSHHALQRYEAQFKARELNILSCSTTMEMGVDIGGLAAVAMNNVPPAAANYLQRAGRAGRRGETAAMALTLCKSNAHGEAVFRQPTWAFDTPIHVPRVSLNSARIIQRHINALLLTHFLKAQDGDTLKLNTGWFFIAAEAAGSQVDAFTHWLTSAQTSENASLNQGLKSLTSGGALQHHTLAQLRQACVEQMEHIQRLWNQTYTALRADLDLTKTAAGSGSVRQKAIEYQLMRITEEYLLKYLTDHGFLPGYGFPSGIIPLVTTVYDDFGNKRKDSRPSYRDYPSRSLSRAIREYAPGSLVVLDNKVYRSRGVTLNWKIPANEKQINEIQAINWLWHCQACGATDQSQARPSRCLNSDCGQPLSAKNYKRVLTPAGFAVHVYDRPHGNLINDNNPPAEEPFFYLGDVAWQPIEKPIAGRYRATANGRINHVNSGFHAHGYAVCLACGFAASEIHAEPGAGTDHIHDLPPLMQNHHRLRGSNHRKAPTTTSGSCEGNAQPFKILRHLRLGGREFSDIFEIQLIDPHTRAPLDKTAATSLGVALRAALCQILSIETGEIGVATPEVPLEDGTPAHTIYLFDQASGGAGYATQAPRLLHELFARARDFLTCPNDCDTACHGCLLAYETLFHAQYLNRFKALELL